MKIAFARTMPHFSMDAYANGLIEGLKSRSINRDIVELRPRSFERHAHSPIVRVKKAHERFWRFPRKVRHQDADIYHVIDHSDAHIVRWLQKTGKPVVVTCHDLVNFIYPENLQGSVRLPLLSDYLARYSVRSMEVADAVIAVSEETASSISQILKVDPKRIFVIPNSVDTHYFCQLPKEQLSSFRSDFDISPNAFCLLNVGGNHPRKNLAGILRVLDEVRSRGVPIQLWKVGDDFKDNDKRYIEANGLEDSIRYFGYIDKALLHKVYNAADALIAPSFHEGFGITLLEAMSCGTPAITSNVSAMPEVVSNAGILVDPTDHKSISDSVIRLYRDRIYYDDLQKKGFERVQLFTPERVADEVLQVYEKLL